MIFFALLTKLALLVATVPHQATLYYQSSECTSNSPCNIKIWRAVCAPTCPTYVVGSPDWTQVTKGSIAASPSNRNTTWKVIDNDPALQDNTTYVYVATITWRSDNVVFSGPSTPWTGTTSGGSTANVPAIPTVGTGNSVH